MCYSSIYLCMYLCIYAYIYACMYVCIYSDSGEVRLILKALKPLIEGCTENFSSQGVGNALYGLQVYP